MTNNITTITSAEFSFFENHRSTQPSKTNIAEVIQKINDPNSRLVEKTRFIQEVYNANGGGKKGKKKIVAQKAKLGTVSFGGTGDRKTIFKSSGFLCIDIDEVGERKEELCSFFRSCPSVVTSFISPSGDGIKAVFRIPHIGGGDQKIMRAKFKKAFQRISQFIYENTGIQADPACSDMLRLTYLPHDPNAYLNEHAVEFTVDIDALDNPAVETASPIEGVKRFKSTPMYIVRPLLLSIAPRPDYEVWLKVSAAVRNALGDNELAIALLKEWSAEEVEGEYSRLLESSPFDDIGIGTLRYYAAQNEFFFVYEQFAYEESTGHYLLHCGSSWVRLRGEHTTKDHLRQFVAKLTEDCPLCQIRTERNVALAGEIAGYPSGIHFFNNRRVLILEGPKIISPIRCDWSVLLEFLETLFPEEEQLLAFLAWLQHCRTALLSGRRRQTPALALVGSRGAGKSLLIWIIKVCLGGRSSSGYRYLSGSTPFNSDVIGSELVVIDDEAASKDFRTRLNLGQNIKAHFFAESVRLEAKGVDAFSVAPIQALVLAVNSDPQHIRVLPEIDETMHDKITLLQTARGELPAELRGSSHLEEVLTREIPGFLHYLESQDFSSHYESGRLRCYWNPQIVEALCIMSPEMQLLALISATPSLAQTCRPGGVAPEFTATEVQAALMENAGTRHAAGTLLSYPAACGTYLGKLANMPESGISRGRLTTGTRVQLYIIDLAEDSH
jgi:hypothetical protein